MSDQLQQILKVIERWNSADISYIERDIVLSKLQNIYQQVLFMKVGVIAPTSVQCDNVSELHSAITTKEVVTTMRESVVCSGVASSLAEKEPIVQEEVVAERVAVQESIVQEEIVAERVAVQEPIVQEEVVAERVTVQEPIVKEEVVAERVAVQEPIVKEDEKRNLADVASEECYIPGRNIRHRFNREAIKSLYDDTCTIKSSTVVVETSTEKQVVRGVETSVNAVATIDTAPCPIIGDVILNGTHTIGEEFSRNNITRDVATSIACGNSLTLKGAIGINDKFLMLKEMFNGDINSYQSAIEILEEFDDMDDALIFIHDNFDWNPNGLGVKLLIELLNRKLS